MPLKIVVTAPLPREMTNTTTNVNTGLFRSIRPANRASASKTLLDRQIYSDI